MRVSREEAEPSHVAGAHPNLSSFIKAVRLMDIRKEYRRSITVTTTIITISSVLQPGKSSCGLSPAKSKFFGCGGVCVGIVLKYVITT